MNSTPNIDANDFLREQFAKYEAQQVPELPDFLTEQKVEQDAMPAPTPVTAPTTTSSPYDNVPADLKQEPRWLVYKLVWDEKKGRNDKKPYHPLTGLPTNDPKQGVLFDVALNHSEDFSGLGFYVEEPYIVTDIDHCRDAVTGVIEAQAMEIIHKQNTYAEVSPSGTGVHIIGRGAKPGKACRKGIEIYSTKRFITVTGNQITGTPNTVNECDITSIYNRMLAGEFTEPKASAVHTESALPMQKPSTQISHTGSILTDKLSLLKNGTIASQKPFVIEDGHGNSLQYESQSEADLALCTLLAMSGLDADAIDDEFRKSSLYRPKWEREDYSSGTIKQAIEGASKQSATITVQANPSATTSWRSKFRNISEMEQGEPVMLIDGVLQEGTCFLGAAPSHGKTLVALAMAKAITLGTPLFELPQYSVKQTYPVLYLIPETSDRPFRRRCEAFRLPTDDRFLVRTITEGASLQLTDPDLLEAVRQRRFVVVLDTTRRFNRAADSNSDAQNQQLVTNVNDLRAAGSPCVILLHHSTKAATQKREAMTLENMLSGTGDFGAMCDHAYGVRRDEGLYNRGDGALEIEIANLKDRERTTGLTQLRLAATYLKVGEPRTRSWIDETGNFRPVDARTTAEQNTERLVRLVESNPMMTLTELVEATGLKTYTVRQTLKALGWQRDKGGKESATPWRHNEVSTDVRHPLP